MVAKGTNRPVFPFVATLLVGLSSSAVGQDALRGKQLYHDVGRLSGAGVSCIDCHGDVPGALHGLGKVANNPAAIAYAVGAIQPMTPLRGHLTERDMADIAAYVAFPGVPSPELRVTTMGPAATPFSSDRLEFSDAPSGMAVLPSTVRLTNTGALPIRLFSAPVVAGPAAEQFIIAAADCAAGMVLAPQQSCAVELVFLSDGEPGLRAASLHFTHDWISGGANVALIGRRSAPAGP